MAGSAGQGPQPRAAGGRQGMSWATHQQHPPLDTDGSPAHHLQPNSLWSAPAPATTPARQPLQPTAADQLAKATNVG